MRETVPSLSAKSDPNPKVFALLMGLMVATIVVKCGNPIILDKVTEPPKDFSEIINQSWPPSWAFYLMVPMAIYGAFVSRFKMNAPKWLVWLPLIWLVWQGISATQTVDGWLTSMTLKHFAAAVACFYLGLFALNRAPNLNLFWWCVLVGFVLALLTGFDQHYGGLESTRRYFYEHAKPGWEKTVNPEFIKRLNSDRIFSSFVYPNAFAGAILLLLPPLIVFVAQKAVNLPRVARGVLVGVLIYAGMACLIWTGSKAGWLIAMVVLVVALLQLPFPQRAKTIAVTVLLVCGLAAFAYKFAGYFKKGATSVSARFDYWHAALGGALQHPVLGSGPGTFSVIYKAVKPPEAEMAQLTHNDYLEQACDSGWPGFVAYVALIGGFFTLVYRKSNLQDDPLRLSVWLGLLGWALQGFVEFGLYLPGLAWPVFLLMGWLTAGVESRPIEIDKRKASR